jgi:membrane protease YdiL (CAAX protease family)
MFNFPALPDHILIWIFGIILPFLSGMQSDKLQGKIIFNESSRRRLYLANSLMLAISGASILVVWFFKDRDFKVLGFNKSIQFSTPLFLVLGIFILSYAIDVFFTKREINQHNKNKEQDWFEKSSFLPEKFRELPSYILLCICAGVFEEIIYRGFMVTYFLPIDEPPTTFPLLALLAPSVLFSLAHYYQGWTSVVKIFIFSTLLSWMFITSRSIYLNMVLHFLIDLISGVVMMQSNSQGRGTRDE